MSDYIPEEVLIMILLRLPTKSLLKCTSVCKSWHSLITSPSFITTHLNAHQNNPTQYLICRQWQWQSSETNSYRQKTSPETYSLVVVNKDNTFGGYEKLEFPFRATNTFFRILDSCNGVLCLVDYLTSYTVTTILWNPMIRKFVCLPEPSFTFRNHGPHQLILRFGFDHTTSDYKVVRMLYPENRGLYNPCLSPPVVELYSLNTGSWKTISPPCCQHVPERNWSQAFVNGAVHWLARFRIGDEFLFQILTFSLSNEVFGEMSVPTCLSNQSAVTDMSITIIGGFLSLVPYARYSYSEWHRTVWVMKEYGTVESWIKLLTINDDLVGPFGRVLGIRNYCDSVLLLTTDKELVFYDYKTCQAIQLGAAGKRCAVYVNSYTESLVLLDKREQNSNNLEK